VAGGQRRSYLDFAASASDSDFTGAFMPALEIPTPAGEEDNRETASDNFDGFHAWGDFANGRIPRESLEQVASGHFLEPQAAAALRRMAVAAAADGVTIELTSSYRDYDSQVDVRNRKGHLVATATPGTSVHGWGRAIDIHNAEARTWVQENGAQFGWVWPQWAQGTGKNREEWHMEFEG
jgi:zinc D-Ala-D-Ala carboxypeptidase